MVNKSAFKKTTYTATDFINAVNDFEFRENQKIAKEKERANINQALAKMESDYREATTPIISLPQKKSGIEAIALNKPFQPTVSYKEVVKESEIAPLSNEGLKDKIVVNDEMYGAIMAEKDRQKTNAELIGDVQTAKARMDSARKMNWFDKVMAELGGYDSTDYAKENYKSAVEKYYQNRYQTDSDLTGILNSLVENNKHNPTEETKRDIEQISSVLYGKGVIDNLISDNAMAGLTGASYGITATGDLLIGNFLQEIGWENNPISSYNDFVKTQYEYWANRGANAAVASGDTKNYSGQLIQGLVGIIPDTVMAIMTSGGSTTTNTLKAIAGSGTKTTTTKALKDVAKLDGKLSPMVSIAAKSEAVADVASSAITNAAKNPMFWSSFTRTYGTDYEQAKENGANELEAQLYAIITSLSNSLVEVGGGIQALPSKLQGKSSSWVLDYIKSNIEEGSEEVIQGLISELNEKFLYDKDKAVLSVTDENAVINPLRMLEEFAAGATIGGIAGGGQVILNSANAAKYTKLGKIVKKSVNTKDLIDYAKKSANENIRNIALQNTGDKISNRDLGILYSYATQNINKAFKSVSTFEDAKKVVQEFASENNPKTINDIVFSAYVSKLSNITPEGLENANVTFNELLNLSAADKKVDPVQKSINAATGTKEYTADQNELKKIGQQFGAKVRFKNLTTKKIDADGNEVVFSPEGTYDPDTNTITLNTDARPEHRPALFILKHEMTHSMEVDKEAYTLFANEVFKSKAFESYMAKRGYDTISAWQDAVIDKYDKQGAPLKGDKRAAANKEIIADFVGDMLFTGDTKTAEQFLKGLSVQSRNGFITAVKRFFAKLKAFFVGDAKLSEIEQLEKQFLEVANKVAKMNKAKTEQQKTTTEEGGGKKMSLLETNVDGNGKQGYNENKNNTEGETINDGQILDVRGIDKSYIRSAKRETEGNERTFFETEGGFVERNEKTFSGRRILRVKQFNFAYSPKRLDSSEASQAVRVFNKIGIKAVYCQGATESNVDDLTTMHYEAVTSPDGVIFVSDTATLPMVDLVSHEAVHVHQKNKTDAYNKLYLSVKHQLKNTGAKIEEAKTKIFNGHYKAKFENTLGRTLTDEEILHIVKSSWYTERFLKEFVAYVNEAIFTNNTKELYSLFKNWSVVVETSKKFNYEIGLNAAVAEENKRYSLPDNATPLQIGNAYKNGEITAEEYEQRISELNRGKGKTLNPYEIANLPKDAADTTPELPKPKRKGKGDGESKLYDSFLESEIVIPELKTEIENDTFIKNYGTTTNKRTLKMAVEELEEGGKARVEEFRTMQPEKASAVDVAVGLILLERYQRANDIEGALVIAEKLREIATVSGQTVQIFSIVGRFTPEMMAAYAQRDLDKAFKILAEKKSQKWVDKNANKYKLTEKEKEFIVNHTVLASQLKDGSRAKAILLAEICTLIENKIPSEMGDKLRALQRVSLLLNVKTQLRNILGNGSMIPTYIASDFFGSLIDKGLSTKTGVRTVGNFQLKGSGKAFGKGMYETYDDFKRGIHTKQQELNRYNNSIKGGKAFNEDHRLKALNYVAKFCNGLDNFTSFCLELGDRPFFEMWFNNSLNNQMRLNNVDIPTPEMLEIAKQEALQRTWQDDNAVTRAVQSVKKSLNMLHIPGTSYGLGDFVLKFTKTPANIAKAMVELSPVGLAISIGKTHNFRNALQKGTFTSAMQKELVRSVSSAITGTMIYTIIAIAASLGWVELSGEGDEDKKVSAFEKYIVGIPPYSMKIFGQNVTYDWNQPLGTVLATVADFMDSKNDDTDSVWYNDLLSAIKTGGAVFTKQSFLTGLYEFFSQEDFVTGIISSLVSEPSAYIPQISSQIASLIDPYRRTTYDPQDSFKTAINGVINKIPGLRQTLPAQVNVLGEESKNVQYLNPWQAFASPGNKYPESSGKVAEEIYKLYQETGTSEVLPKKAANKITVKGNTITFTVEETAEIQKKIGKTSVELLEKVFDSSDFKNLDEELKIKVVKKVYEYASQNMKTTLDYDYETISEIMGGQDVLTQEKYKKLGKQGVQVILNEYFLSKAERKCKGDPEKLVELFIKQTIKNSK